MMMRFFLVTDDNYLVDQFTIKMSSFCSRAKFPVDFVNKKCPRGMFLMARFCLLLLVQNLFLLHQQLVMVLVARIHLLWILEV